MMESEHRTGEVDQELTPEEKSAQAIERNQQELARRREAGELEPTNYEVNNILYLQENDLPLTRKEIGNRVVVIKPEEFESLGYLDLVLASSEKITIDLTEQNPVDLIIFPEELGDLE